MGETETRFMQEAIRLAAEKMEAGWGGPFGAVVVYAGRVVGRGWNAVLRTHDPTAHAEIMAIREAGRALQRFHLDDCDLYTSCEPCPMCLGAIYWARLRRVYYAATRHDAASAGFIDAWLYTELTQPLKRRSIPFTPLLRDRALAVFELWRDKPDKTPY